MSKIADSVFSSLKTDMHSHLLPGIDDGAESMEDSLMLIEGLFNLGFQKLTTSPHIYQELYPNTPETINEKLVLVQSVLAEQKIPVELDAAAEYMLDEGFEKVLTENRFLLIENKYILVETNFLSAPNKLLDYIFKLQIKGFTPILAHPERYVYMQQDKDVFHRCKSRGVMMQVNILSISGYYGRDSEKFAKWIISKGWCDFLGTDVHHKEHLEALQSFSKSRSLRKMIEKGLWKNTIL